jgi:chromosome segregation ATPase
MKTLSVPFKKTVLVALVAALVLATLPVTSVSASGLNDPSDPPADTTRLSDERLERIWARMQRIYERQGHILERADAMVERFQNLIDRLEENGKDVTALQAALDAFDNALKEAHPIYESAKGIINSHQGFDADGKVTDSEKALETIKDLGSKLKEIREIVGEPGKALREAFKAFRDANRPADTSGA